jgi:hypothetical protein
MPRKTDGEKIDDLLVKTAALDARLIGHDQQFETLSELVKKAQDIAGVHLEKITSVEKEVIVLVDLKGRVGAIASIREDLVAIKKDLDGLKSWKDEQKKERDEAARRKWAFGPNLVAALVSGIISVGIALLVWWLNRPR